MGDAGALAERLAHATRGGERAVLHALALELDKRTPASSLFASQAFVDAVLALMRADSAIGRAARARIFTSPECARDLRNRSENARAYMSSFVAATLRAEPGSLFDELLHFLCPCFTASTRFDLFVSISEELGQRRPPMFYVQLHLRENSLKMGKIVEEQLNGTVHELSACVTACARAGNARVLRRVLETSWACRCIDRLTSLGANNRADSCSFYGQFFSKEYTRGDAGSALDDLRAAVAALPCAALAAHMCAALQPWTGALGHVLDAPVDLCALWIVAPPPCAGLATGLDAHPHGDHLPVCWRAATPAFAIELAHCLRLGGMTCITAYWSEGVRALARLELGADARRAIGRAVDALSCACITADIWPHVDAALAACASAGQHVWLRDLVARMMHAIDGMYARTNADLSRLSLDTLLLPWGTAIDIGAACDPDRAWPTIIALNVLGTHSAKNYHLARGSPEHDAQQYPTHTTHLRVYTQFTRNLTDLQAREARGRQLDVACYDIERTYGEYVARAVCASPGDADVHWAARYVVALLYVRRVADVLGAPPAEHVVLHRGERPQDCVWFTVPLLPRLDWAIARALLARAASDTWNASSAAPAPALMLARWSPERHRHATRDARVALCALLVLARGASQMALRAPAGARGALDGLRSLPNELLFELYARVCDAHNTYANVLHETFTHEHAPTPGWPSKDETFAPSSAPRVAEQ